jgi:hypothetical protein
VCRRCKKACDDVRAAHPGVAGATRLDALSDTFPGYY